MTLEMHLKAYGQPVQDVIGFSEKYVFDGFNISRLIFSI